MLEGKYSSRYPSSGLAHCTIARIVDPLRGVRDVQINAQNVRCMKRDNNAVSLVWPYVGPFTCKCKRHIPIDTLGYAILPSFC